MLFDVAKRGQTHADCQGESRLAAGERPAPSADLVAEVLTGQLCALSTLGK
jgi:hypothetical protein